MWNTNFVDHIISSQSFILSESIECNINPGQSGHELMIANCTIHGNKVIPEPTILFYP